MARRFLAQLQDVLAQIGLDRGDAVLFQMLVDPQLLGDHRLALGDRARIHPLADRQHRRAGILGRAAPVHVAAGFLDVGGPGFQIEIEIGERVILDVPPDIAQGLELRQRRHGGAPPAGE